MMAQVRRPKDFKVGNHILTVGCGYPKCIEAVSTPEFTYLSLAKFKKLRKWLDRAIDYLEQQNKGEK